MGRMQFAASEEERNLRKGGEAVESRSALRDQNRTDLRLSLPPFLLFSPLSLSLSDSVSLVVSCSLLHLPLFFHPRSLPLLSTFSVSSARIPRCLRSLSEKVAQRSSNPSATKTDHMFCFLGIRNPV
ncbi:hypothetical protein ASPSYDRAFT_327858 [Aspergillus sydowii CBS 593.65]|uniref:Uncharacterized protein n=1 Tax=Aspergillus sydowii CBS 593.65 TaxID=1036612 RepID=A0A1L9TYY6_9EURO|nr:uncharacterized protein ASPSYDRAFT_327858 [Aspergillus sydowii CBS 593.65]OJJ64493.1 hypothetical protein ASPSYDRAFT_327858 [Aspergillus sydowii CBS 593.65]